MKKTLDETHEIKLLISQLKAFCMIIRDILRDTHIPETGRYACFRDMAGIYNDFTERAKKLFKVQTMFYTFNINDIPSWGDSVWPTQKRILEQVLVCAEILLASLEEHIDFADDEFENIKNFLQTNIRAAVFQRPEKEIEIQNAIESLLLGRGLSKGIDYDRESGKFAFSGKEYIPDFVISKMSLCIEVKLLREGRKSRVIDEIGADITAYQKMYSRQLYIVYDLGVIQNEIEFKRDIEKVDGVKVIIIKH